MLVEKEELEANDFEEAEVLYDEFLEVIINGGGYQGICDILAQKLQAGILIENEFFRVRARSHFDKPTFSNIYKKNRMKYWKPQRMDPRITKYVHLLQSTLRPVSLPELPEYGIPSPRLVFPLVIKNKIKEYLNIFKKDLNWDQMKVVRAALHSLAVLETCRQVQVELEDRNKKDLILGLISSDKGENHNIHGEKRLLSFDLSRQAVLSVIQLKAAPGQWQIEEVLRSIISDLYINASPIAISDEKAVLLIQSTDEGTLESEVVTESLQMIFEALKMNFANCKVKIGVGRQCFRPRDYKVAFDEACKALSFKDLKPDNEEGVIYYHSLRLMGVLLQPANEQNLPVFVWRILGKLHDYSVAHNINLIESLECYLKHSCNIRSAAKELFIHPNTLRYRLEKVEKISGLDLTDTDTKLEIQLAIKLYRYQGESFRESGLLN